MKKHFKGWLDFVTRVIKSFARHELYLFAGDMTYKLVLSIFPLIMFIFSFVGFFHGEALDSEMFLNSVTGALPAQVAVVIENFVYEVVDTRNTALLSTSLFVTLFSASSGFASVIKGINSSYGQRDARSWLHVRLISIVLVLLFVLILALSMGIMVFSGAIYDFVYRYMEPNRFINTLFGFIGYLASVLVILAIIVTIYKVGSCRRVRITQVIPGSCVTVVLWVLFSRLYNIYITNFARYTIIYGSIGSIFILLIWLNCLTSFLLLGSQFNACLANEYSNSET